MQQLLRMDSWKRSADGTCVRAMAVAEKKRPGRFYFNVTVSHSRSIERGRIWTFEQEQVSGFSSVTTNTRMSVIKLKSGLWVHAPIATTEECIQLLKVLDTPVEYIILPTFAYERKIFFVGPFFRKFPTAQLIE